MGAGAKRQTWVKGIERKWGHAAKRSFQLTIGALTKRWLIPDKDVADAFGCCWCMGKK